MGLQNIDLNRGNSTDILVGAYRDKAAARRYFKEAIEQNGEHETLARHFSAL
ncbi:hypothetical protein BN2475_140057 [Paraburkholderia ribeironis]|uniref:Uncharacterized protein n=1 Tax=Paraburkholderia ribeironis TaxID=1247936 RepID=A0A1N7RSV3_9BURK|nr:hypothetical protein BN2475_140057 [Paraburkholderia ribeironis]